MRPRDSRLEGVYAAASNGTTNLHDAWVEALKPTTWSSVQRGYKAYMNRLGPQSLQHMRCLRRPRSIGVDEAAQAGGFFAEAFTGDADAADAASGGRGQHERGASVRLPTRSPVHVDVHGRSAGAKIRLYARLCRTPSARPMCAARSGGPTQRSLGVYV